MSRICLVVAAFVVLASFAASRTGHTATSPPAVVVETQQDRMALVLIALAEAINNPIEFNLDVLSSVLPPDQQDQFRDRIQRLAQKSPPEHLMRFDMRESVRTDAGFQVVAEASYHAGSFAARKVL